MESYTIAEAIDRVRNASQEEIAAEVVVLREGIEELLKQIDQKKRYADLLNSLVGDSLRDSTETELVRCQRLAAEVVDEKSDKTPVNLVDSILSKTENGKWTPTMARCRMAQELLRRRGPMACTDIAKALGVSYGVMYSDLLKRDCHYFRHREDGKWEAKEIDYPQEEVA